jgi:hypothetical protein
MPEPASPQTVHNEKTKLLAGLFNSGAIACVAAGIVGRTAAFFYGVPPTVNALLFALFAIVWLVVAAALHGMARLALNGLLRDE